MIRRLSEPEADHAQERLPTRRFARVGRRYALRGRLRVSSEQSGQRAVIRTRWLRPCESIRQWIRCGLRRLTYGVLRGHPLPAYRHSDGPRSCRRRSAPTAAHERLQIALSPTRRCADRRAAIRASNAPKGPSQSP